jgi:YidC/Oxa1 family membrane protein insertase
VFNFLYTAVSWVLLQWHHLFSALGLNEDGGLNWALSIVFLVITARLLLFRLFIKQVHYQRHMQEIQPKIQALREKYKSDRAEMQRQMMKLQQEQGFNPLAGCLPMVLQIPIFLSLFHVLRHLSNSVHRSATDPKLSLYSFTPKETLSAARAKLWDAPLAASLHDSSQKIHDLFGDPSSTRIVTIVLVVISAAATFLTQRLVISRQTVAPTGTAATVQRLMIVFIPISVLFSGIIFPLGVLLYWFTSNVWTLGQQAYINRFHPHQPAQAAPVGQAGKALAPKPGQRPVRVTKPVPPARPVKPGAGSGGPNGTAGGTSGTSGTDEGTADDVLPAASNGAAPRSAPRPGQRPNRPSGNRPPAKRKKRR